MIAKYRRKKPPLIEAIQWDGTANGAGKIINWILSKDSNARYSSSGSGQIYLDTPEDGVVIVRRGDWVVRNTVGEFYKLTTDEFVHTYEEAKPDEPLKPVHYDRLVGQLRTKANELSHGGRMSWDSLDDLRTAIILIADLLANHLEDTERERK